MRRPAGLILAIILLIICSGCFWARGGGGYGEHDRGGSREQDRWGYGDRDRGGYGDRERGEHEEWH